MISGGGSFLWGNGCELDESSVLWNKHHEEPNSGDYLVWMESDLIHPNNQSGFDLFAGINSSAYPLCQSGQKIIILLYFESATKVALE